MPKLKPLLAYPYYRVRGYRPVKVAPSRWDEEFRAGKWDYLADLAQTGCRSIVFSYRQELAPEAILDVGCGPGTLVRSIRLLDYKRYLGIDVSREAIARAERAYRDDRTEFLTADAEAFRPRQAFDLIVFNNSLYYMAKPDAVVRNTPDI